MVYYEMNVLKKTVPNMVEMELNRTQLDRGTTVQNVLKSIENDRDNCTVGML